MEQWEQELDQYLAPYGVVFSRQASTQTFKQEMRERVRSIHLPLLSSVLLYDGAGSLIIRVTSLIILVWMCACMPKTPFATIFFTIISLPGLWMWWYRLAPPEKRIQRMQALFEKHAGTF